MSSPFDVLAPLRDKLRKKPDLNTLKVWNGNEHATLEQLVTAVPPVGGWEGYIKDMDK